MIPPSPYLSTLIYKIRFAVTEKSEENRQRFRDKILSDKYCVRVKYARVTCITALLTTRKRVQSKSNTRQYIEKIKFLQKKNRNVSISCIVISCIPVLNNIREELLRITGYWLKKKKKKNLQLQNKNREPFPAQSSLGKNKYTELYFFWRHINIKPLQTTKQRRRKVDKIEKMSS